MRVGISVWWDGDLNGSDPWEETIQNQAKDAKFALVLWARHSVHSAWVLAEADAARRQERLIPARRDATPLPLGFTQIQTTDLADWSGQLAHSGWESVLVALRQEDGVREI